MLLSRDTKEHNFTEVNCEQRTGLDFAVEMGHSEIVQLIKQHGEACGIPRQEEIQIFIQPIKNLKN